MPAISSKSRDDLVMATNNSSIISKRSVERIYFPDEAHYYRYFVKKFQRRAPLINRGYYLRMHLIESTVSTFLKRPSSKPKVVVNLGCGSDALPWKCLSRHAQHCQGVKFLDIDFPDVIAAKERIVKETPELQTLLTNLEFPSDPYLLLRSDQYCQIACDLREVSAIDSTLSKLVAVPSSEFLFVAEVSVAYMEPVAADALIRWASTIGQAEFCLLEQILPDGPSNPFAQTMLQHFEKLGTPLKCIDKYPSTEAQQKRFRELGWPETRSWSLWNAWSDPFFLSCSDRKKLDELEVFDEWEEFVNFASHYFLLLATNHRPSKDKSENIKSTSTAQPRIFRISMDFSPTAAYKSIGRRRFGAPLVMKDVLGQSSLANFFGTGTEGRLRSYDIYSKDTIHDITSFGTHQGGPTARICFTLTDVGDSGYLLVGGRMSPTDPLDDSWVFKKDSNQWHRTHSLPLPLFRHSVTHLHGSGLVLLAGGKSSSSAIFPGYLLYHPSNGWAECVVDSSFKPPPLFGSTFVCAGRVGDTASIFYGIMAGGMTIDGTIYNRALGWKLDVSNIQEPSLTFELMADEWVARLLGRFGATCAQVDGWAVLVGGVGHTGSLPRCYEIVQFRAGDDGKVIVNCMEFVHSLGQGIPRPILIGTSAIGTGGSEVAILGGGMTCFSMGTAWSEGVYTFRVCPESGGSDCHTTKSAGSKIRWKYSKTATISNESIEPPNAPDAMAGPPKIVSTRRIRLESIEQFGDLLQRGQPAVIEGLDLGSCTVKWDADYLVQQLGADRKVVIHESTSQAMDFVSKNFRYVTRTFGDFIRDVREGKMVYLRALSAEKPSDIPTRLDVDFPTLSSDFVLPPQLAYPKQKLVSSVLRISGPVNMWLHYDVLANVYSQIQGSKRFLLFPPSDVTRLGFGPGASSSSIDMFSSTSTHSLSRCQPQEATVGPGDVLFLPRLWLHTATPLSGSSIAVNVFFRDLENGYSLGRDVYGNRDLAAYEKARQDIAKIMNGFKGLPRDTKLFYLQRIIDELAQKATG